MNRGIDNLGPERFLLQHLKTKPANTNYAQKRQIFDEIMNNPSILHEVKQNIFIEGSILEELEKTSEALDNEAWDSPLRDEVIQVGEFEN